MSNEHIAEIREQLEKTSPGDWRADHGSITDNDAGHYCVVVKADNHECPAHCYGPRHRAGNADFIAQAKSNIRFLLAELAARDADIAELQEALQPFAGYAATVGGDRPSLLIGYYSNSPTVGDCRKAAEVLAKPIHTETPKGDQS